MAIAVKSQSLLSQWLKLKRCCSSSATAVVQQRVEALQLLQYFLSPGNHATQLTDTVQELAINAFPASSWEWRRGTTQSTDYARQLMAIMDSMVAAAERGLSVEPLLQVGASLTDFPASVR